MASVRMIRSDDLLNILASLFMAGCDIATLATVAQAAGIGEEFRAWLREQQPGTLQVTVESCLVLVSERELPQQ